MTTTTIRTPGRRVQRARLRTAGVFKAQAKRRRLVSRYGIKGADAYVPGEPAVDEHKDRTLAGKARRAARR